MRRQKSHEEPLRGEEISLEELKQAELEIFKKILDFTKDKDLYLSLVGGTLLGAVRHQGFIPWDDDIDLCMPRGDFERLISYAEEFEQVTGYKLEGAQDVALHKAPYLKVVDKSILTTSRYALGYSAAWVDIMPVDGLPHDYLQVKQIYKNARILRTLFVLPSINPATGGNLVKNTAKFLGHTLGKIPLVRAFWLYCLLRLARRIPFASTEYCGIVTWGLYGPGERMPVKEFVTRVFLNFEGISAPAMACWDEYLHGIYGDYKKLPPESARVRHTTGAWRVAQ